jgi:hypothetical protein
MFAALAIAGPALTLASAPPARANQLPTAALGRVMR